jgi:hypothetical protein
MEMGKQQGRAVWERKMQSSDDDQLLKKPEEWRMLMNTN